MLTLVTGLSVMRNRTCIELLHLGLQQLLKVGLTLPVLLQNQPYKVGLTLPVLLQNQPYKRMQFAPAAPDRPAAGR